MIRSPGPLVITGNYMPKRKLKIEIGKVYLDVWGRKHEIMGRAKGYHSNRKFFWSSSDHFDEYGKSTSRHDLVVLEPKAEAAFWTKKIEEIKRLNSEDKLRLVSQGIYNMEQRIRELTPSQQFSL